MRWITPAFILIATLPFQAQAQALTLATWNTKHLGWGDKRDWQFTAQVVAPYDFVALQEVHGQDSVARLEQELEALTGTEWSSLVSSEPVGRSRYKEDYAFIWREAVVDYVGGAVTYLDPGDQFEREPFAARFCTDDASRCWTAASVHLIYGDSVAERRAEARVLDDLVSWLEDNVAEGSPVLVMGDFNLSPDSMGFQELDALLDPAIHEGATTLSETDGRFANLYDNIWYRGSVVKPTDARIDPFPQRLGLNHKEARQKVSDHTPVVITLGGGPQDGSSATAASALTIICVQADAPGNDVSNPAGEWVRIANQGRQAVDLAGWVLADDADHRGELQGRLDAGGQVDLDSEIVFGKAVWNNDGDTVRLIGPDGHVVSDLAYTASNAGCEP